MDFRRLWIHPVAAGHGFRKVGRREIQLSLSGKR
jgi:hypothetical protein